MTTSTQTAATDNRAAYFDPTEPNPPDRVKRLIGLVEELYPICRSITGDGLRKSLGIIKKQLPLTVHEVPTGEKVFDWTIPKEWNIRDAWIKNSKGKKIVDFNDSNLHVLNYSIPVHTEVGLEQLKQHLFTLPDQPDLIPYRTSYYKEQWGFCMAHNQFLDLKEDRYQVMIDSSVEDGHLSYGELLIEGKSSDEVLISSHICHPSLCNDNLSGVSVAVHLAEELMQKELKYSYRFLFIPGTIGSICWLARNEDHLERIKYGLVLSCLGDSGPMTYKRSRRGTAAIDRIAEKALAETPDTHEIRDFSPYGYDERQYCSPGIDLPVGCLMRTPFGEFPEYHTSADDLDFVKGEALADSLSRLETIVFMIENNRRFHNINPKCEPNLGKRGLYKTTGGEAHEEADQLAILWTLNLSDGDHSLLDIAERSGLSFRQIYKASVALERVQLLKPLT